MNPIRNPTDSSIHIKSKTSINNELNVLDVLITNDLKNKNLTNDVHETDELRVNSLKDSKKEPTPVTLANVCGGKKDRNVKHQNLRVLIDTGCSHSILQKKYSSKRIKESTKKYSTGNGTLTTDYETEVHFTLPEFSDKKIVNWTFSATDSPHVGYDMIIR